MNNNDMRLKFRNQVNQDINSSMSDTIDLFNQFITLLQRYRLNIHLKASNDTDISNNIKSKLNKQVIMGLFWKAISQSESILILISNGKYVEAYSLLRNLFENSVFILYISEYPFEAKRWLQWSELNEPKNERKFRAYKRMKFPKFREYLINNGFNELRKKYRKKNFKHYRDFDVWFIRKESFKSHPKINGKDYKKYYSMLCSFVHPSFKTLNHNDKVSENNFKDISVNCLFITRNLIDIFTDEFNSLIDDELKNEYKKLKDEIIKFEAERDKCS